MTPRSCLHMVGRFMFLKNNSDRFCFLCKNPPVASHQNEIQGSSPWPAGPAQSASLSLFSCSSPTSLSRSGPASPAFLLPLKNSSLLRTFAPVCSFLCIVSSLTLLSSLHVTVSDHSVYSNTVLLFSKSNAEKMSLDVFADCCFT